ncbi:MAG TPA: thioredoxin-dependent thiol peroxidase [Longimicrobiales bacterium]|nr:thioredoxin-dependent thiol peroxidase [Longimicrobiales bacterium]
MATEAKTGEMPAPGTPAPEFKLQTDEGHDLSLRDLRGRKVVLYFYPKDDTPGCTKQACGLRDRIGDIEKTGAKVLGVSPDSVKSHQKFRDKFDLPFTLLADEDHAVADAYGVWKEKSMYGKKYWGNERTTFIIDEDGRIAHVLPKVKPEEHADQILELL